MKALVEVITKSLVDHPEEVVITEKTEGKAIVLEVKVADSDMGKVMKAAKEKCGAAADGKTINEVVKGLLK